MSIKGQCGYVSVDAALMRSGRTDADEKLDQKHLHAANTGGKILFSTQVLSVMAKA